MELLRAEQRAQAEKAGIQRVQQQRAEQERERVLAEQRRQRAEAEKAGIQRVQEQRAEDEREQMLAEQRRQRAEAEKAEIKRSGQIMQDFEAERWRQQDESVRRHEHQNDSYRAERPVAVLDAEAIAEVLRIKKTVDSILPKEVHRHVKHYQEVGHDVIVMAPTRLRAQWEKCCIKDAEHVPVFWTPQEYSDQGLHSRFVKKAAQIYNADIIGCPTKEKYWDDMHLGFRFCQCYRTENGVGFTD